MVIGKGKWKELGGNLLFNSQAYSDSQHQTQLPDTPSYLATSDLDLDRH